MRRPFAGTTWLDMIAGPSIQRVAVSDPEARFRQAVEEARNAASDGPYRPSNDDKLRMHAL